MRMAVNSNIQFSSLTRIRRGVRDPGIFLYAAAVLLIIAAFLGSRKLRTAFFWPSLLLAFTLFNPYLFPFLFLRWPELIEQYYSTFWAVPVTMILGASAVVVAWRFQKIWARTLVLLAAAALIAAGAVPSIRAYRHIVMPSNFMKSDPELVTLCDYIADYSEMDHPLVAFEREDFADEAAAYDPSIRISDLLYTPGAEESGEVGRTNGEQFIIISKQNKALAASVKQAGYRAVAHTPDSLVFVPRD